MFLVRLSPKIFGPIFFFFGSLSNLNMLALVSDGDGPGAGLVGLEGGAGGGGAGGGGGRVPRLQRHAAAARRVSRHVYVLTTRCTYTRTTLELCSLNLFFCKKIYLE